MNDPSFLTDYDLHLFGEGNFYRSYEKFGAHVTTRDGVPGTRFAVWAPNAREVSVIGDFNGWRWGATPLSSRGGSGVWDGFVPGVGAGTLYKFGIKSNVHDFAAEKIDPYATLFELRPKSACVVWDIAGYGWTDGEWAECRWRRNALDAPISIYEVHMGSWRRVPHEGNRWMTYREMAQVLPPYVAEMGFTHVELLPMTEHPFDGSWGYQTIGYFAPTSRFGTPQDFMHLVNELHRAGIGVILDWVPAHFPRDWHGLAYFDGTHLYEHADPRQREHKDWGTYIFNYGRNEVGNFLISSALYWLDKFHIDGLRVDAVASMLYLDYSRKAGEWIPNRHGGRENLEAIAFVKRFNAAVFQYHPGCTTYAEESTSFPAVSRPTYVGGLGFGYKWNMGWMHDTLQYFSRDPIHRKFHHDKLTFAMIYAHHENFVLPYSHDEVVHGKGSMLGKMPGDGWQKFANLRALYGYMWGFQGKKLLFMGCEFGQGDEWNHDGELQWGLLQFDFQRGLKEWVRHLNHLLKSEPALWRDFDAGGFSWIDCNDTEQSILSFLRTSHDGARQVAVIGNFTPVPRFGYRIGVPRAGFWREVLNSDAHAYGGSGAGNWGGVAAEPIPMHGHPYSISLTLPPLSTVFLAPED
ncbi:1,4-alpha-glucan branching protein GlgB [bacterium]|nr:1,4-alpha-glucan branching protein GlgB [bacterium]